MEKVLSKYAKPGKLLLPIPREDDYKDPTKFTYKQQYYFRSINLKSMEGFISPNGTHEIDIDSKVDCPSCEVHMATVWILLKKGAQVGINIGFRGSDGPNDFENRINAKIYLRPDVILAAMPDACRILDQQIKYGRGVRVSFAPADK